MLDIVLAHATPAAIVLGVTVVARYAIYCAFGVYVASKDPNALRHLGAMHPRARRSLGRRHADRE